MGRKKAVSNKPIKRKSREKTSSKTMKKFHSNEKNVSVAHIIKNRCSSKTDNGSNENLPMFKLKLDETWQNSDGFCRRSTFGKNIPKANKTIMMIGATGAGKTTLINSMINYILGVQWEDNFRFVLIDEGKQKSQAESQTSQITAYQINHMDGFRVPYSLTIVDTPGFGDTRGISHDQKITKQIQEFFSAPGGIDRIDAVCFVVQASLARLTHTQKYIFDSILSIFGKDIAENILVMVTFADGKTPPVLEAIKASEVTCSTNKSGDPLHFKFNNSAVFASNNKTAEDEESYFENFDQMFWKLGISSMTRFFKSLNERETKSLVLTQEVLKERRQLEVLVEGLQPHIKAGLTNLDKIRKTRAALEQHKAEMDANKDFEYELEVIVPKQIENTTGSFLTNCQTCHSTCHDACVYAEDKDKDKCCVMKDGKCTVCPGNCAWGVHANQKYKWDYVTEKRKETYQDLKKRFEAAHGKVTSKEKIFEKLEMGLVAVQYNVARLIEKSKNSLERLQEIALKPNPLSTPDYIDLMIESEKQEAKPGFQDRIQSLMEVRKKAEIISQELVKMKWTHLWRLSHPNIVRLMAAARTDNAFLLANEYIHGTTLDDALHNDNSCGKLEPDPLIALFGTAGEDDMYFTAIKRRILSFASLLARRAVLLMWKDAAPPTHAQWLRDIMTCLDLEKIRYSVCDSNKKFEKVWGPFLKYFENLKSN
ncbi:Stonustoxin subunit alpha [Labeo rohita]|uniref:Stonustoxin subunit alpha n=1 Tax=Labeo rohita TaxID=84645 RepID=A0A498N882_LABRO|nr:Stonustoxin subunit alpha [Labeo rohita]